VVARLATDPAGGAAKNCATSVKVAGEGGRAVGLERQEVIAAAFENFLGDCRLRADRVDGDQRAAQRQAFEQQRNGNDLVRLAAHRFLSEHQPLPARPGGHQMQRFAALVAGMRAPRRLAVDRDDIGIAGAQSLDPGRKAALEQVGINRPDHLAQRVVARDAVHKRPQAAQKRQMALAPQRHLDKIIGPGQRRAQKQAE